MTGSTSGAMVYEGNPYSPVGTVLGPGSTGLRMTPREEQVATLLSLGYNYKRIAHSLGISMGGVGDHVAAIAARIPGTGRPQTKVSAWMWTYGSNP